MLQFVSYGWYVVLSLSGLDSPGKSAWPWRWRHWQCEELLATQHHRRHEASGACFENSISHNLYEIS